MLRNLRRIRQEQRFSQRVLGELVGLRQQTIANYENGLRPSDPGHVTRLAQALGVEESALIADHVVLGEDGKFHVAPVVVTCG